MRDQLSNSCQRLHCRELDGERSGILMPCGERIELYFVGYGEFLDVVENRPIYVITEEGVIASLHANVPGRDSSRVVAIKFGDKDCSRESDQYRRVFESGIISNLPVIGPDAWRVEDLVRRLSFNVAHTEHILRHWKKRRSLGHSSLPREDQSALYRVRAEHVTLTADFTAIYDGASQGLTDCHPTFSIEFSPGVPLDEIRAHVFRYLSFLSFNLGGRMAPSKVRIDRLSLEEMARAVEAGRYVGDHKVIWNWPADEHATEDLAFHGAPFLAVDDEELAAFAGGLAAWIDRSGEWERAYTSMTGSLRLRRVISGERLLAAWRWFEELPNTGTERARDDVTVEKIIKAAIDAACVAGRSDLDGRIRGSLWRIGEETMRDRFARLVGTVRTRFGDQEIFEDLIDHLENARSFRGRVAHGHFAPRDDDEFRRFSKATLALEALCYLLTARDLPMTEAGKRRLWSHPVLEGYQLAYS